MGEWGPQATTLRVTGRDIPDPYRWLDADSPEALAWSHHHDSAGLRYLSSIPGLTGLAEHVRPHLESMYVRPPRPWGSLWLTLRRRAGRNELVLGPRIDGVEAELFVDPLAFGAVDVEGFWPSPTGAAVAVALRMSVGGEVRIVLLRPDGTDRSWGGPAVTPLRPAWEPTGHGLYYGGPTEDRSDPAQIYRLELDGAGPTRIGTIEHPSAMVQPQLSLDGRYLAATCGITSPRPHFVLDLADIDLAEKPTEHSMWRPFLAELDNTFVGSIMNDNYIAATDHDADRGRVVAIPLDTPDQPDSWRELVPESEVVIRSVEVIADHLVIAGIKDGSSHLRILSHKDGGSPWTVPLPPYSTIGTDARSWSHMPVEEPGFVTDASTITFLTSQFTQSPAVLQLQVDAAPGTAPHTAVPSSFSHPELEVKRHRCPSSDGAAVPLWVVRHTSDADLWAPAPTVLYGYGGWNNAFLPVYLAGFLPFLRAGGRIVLPNLRGGGEAGRAWWQAGKGAQKVRTIDDLTDVADWLISTGSVVPGRLAVMGASLGGMNALALMLRRPEVLGAAVALVPAADLLRDFSSPDAYGPRGEYGDPADEACLDALLAYSPYQNITPAVFPPTYVACAEFDDACPPGESRKVVARLNELNLGINPIVFRCWPDSEHIAGELGTAEQTAEWAAFLAEHLGMAREPDPTPGWS